MTRPSMATLVSVGRISAASMREVTFNTSPQRFDVNSSGENSRKFFESRFIFITSRRNLPWTRVASALREPGEGSSTAYSRKSGRRTRRLLAAPQLQGRPAHRRAPHRRRLRPRARRVPAQVARQQGRHRPVSVSYSRWTNRKRRSRSISPAARTQRSKASSIAIRWVACRPSSSRTSSVRSPTPSARRFR